MKADLICVGDELLTGLFINSNVNFLAQRLWSVGITVRESSVVGDNYEAIKAALERAMQQSDLVIFTGGLGPTDDDVTREAVASTLGLSLILDQKWLERLEQFFKKRGYKMTDNNRKQALIIEGGRLLENKRGTAPGILLQKDNKIIVLFPGPPNEMNPMFDEEVLPFLRSITEGYTTRIKTLKCIGIGESVLEERIKALGCWELPPISYLAKGSEVHLQIKGYGDPETAAAAIEEGERRLRSELGEHIYGCDDETLISKVAEMFLHKGYTLSLAESCSGGLLSDMFTDYPGSSGFYKGAVVPYSVDAKVNILNLDKNLLEEEGIVSEAVARAMAESVKQLFKTDFAVGITGVAGPASDSYGTSIGLVCIAVCGPQGIKYVSSNLGGGRRTIKERATKIALNLLRMMLLSRT